jgi:hypothetical protein
VTFTPGSDPSAVARRILALASSGRPRRSWAGWRVSHACVIVRCWWIRHRSWKTSMNFSSSRAASGVMRWFLMIGRVERLSVPRALLFGERLWAPRAASHVADYPFMSLQYCDRFGFVFGVGWRADGFRLAARHLRNISAKFLKILSDRFV